MSPGRSVCGRTCALWPLMVNRPASPGFPPRAPGGGNRTLSGRTDTIIDRVPTTRICISWPSPPRYRPGPPESGTRRLCSTTTGA